MGNFIVMEGTVDGRVEGMEGIGEEEQRREMKEMRGLREVTVSLIVKPTTVKGCDFDGLFAGENIKKGALMCR